MNAQRFRRKTFLLLAMLLSGGMASAQVLVNGNVYGGGEYGKVTENASVTIREFSAEKTTVVKGNVYGGGKGSTDDKKDGWVKGNTTVTMYAGQVESSIYGGGQLGSVGTFNDSVLMVNNSQTPPLELYVPTACAPNTGLATVNISGGLVGLEHILMPHTLNPEGDEYGCVFCGGQGEADSITYAIANQLAVVGSTSLHISGTALIAASAYGGSENGLVLGNTNVQMSGGQIGIGHYKERTGEVGAYVWEDRWDGPYTETQWTTAINAVKNANTDGDPSLINAVAANFHECDAFPYGIDHDNNPSTPKKYYVYDIFYGQHVDPDDPTSELYTPDNSSTIGSNGHSFFGNLFGGGSGFYPFRPGVWRRTAGRVNGDTRIEFTGGHILTSIYGGNEYTDVLGKCTVIMRNGTTTNGTTTVPTLGVPRTLDSIAKHPVTCYLYGAGMGDLRDMFDTWTNVNNVEVEVSGGHVFGSVFGGGEEGHVKGNVAMTIKDAAYIGTWGYSYVDGNIFGGGRGFSGEDIMAGAVRGNIGINIKGGTMLGSIYGGGRLASVGISTNGEMQTGDSHGKVTIDIGGEGQTTNITIGNDYESKLHHKEHTYGGNVYGGSMGRLTKLDNTTNDNWPYLGKVKKTDITIDQATGKTTVIKGNVYGGGEYGAVTENATINIKDGTIWRDVYGGGKGSEDITMTAPFPYTPTGGTPTTVQVKPMQRAGIVEGNTFVNISGGWVKKCVYGGGEMASVGRITDSIKHPHPTDWNDAKTGHPCHLSWPYEFTYAPNTGTVTVNVTGGRIGITGKDYMGPWNAAGWPIHYAATDVNQVTPIPYVLTDANSQDVIELKAAREDNGDVFGAGRGKAGSHFIYAHLCNINNAVVTIDIPDNSAHPVTPATYKPAKPYENNPDINSKIDYIVDFHNTYGDWITNEVPYGIMGCIPGALYGGGENGHVYTDTDVTLTKGLIGHNIYGGGKGSDTYETTLYDFQEDPEHPGTYNQVNAHSAEIISITGGKVYGNTYVTVDGGYVVRNVFGGGNRASVGKGNYAGGTGDYQTNGYGEVWDNNHTNDWPEDDEDYMLNLLATTGITHVYINGGQIGTANGDKDDLPTGNVFGSSRGEAAPNVPMYLSPRYLYCPEFFLGYVNNTEIRIGENVVVTPVEGVSPRLYGSVYGGGQDGHVRMNTNVVVNDAEIGNAFTEDNIDLVGTHDLNHFHWLARGNVYGSGSGLGQYKDADENLHYNYSSGSVTQKTEVTINGGIIHRNVYGGGSLATVGPPRISGQSSEPTPAQSLAKVNINSTIGIPEDVKGRTYTFTEIVGEGDEAHEVEVTDTYYYGGNVFGGSRGMIDSEINLSMYSTVSNTQVNLGKLTEEQNGTTVTINKANVLGNVYGGGELGQVKKDTDVNMNDGLVGTIEYRTEGGSAIYTSLVHTSGGNVFGGGKGLNTIQHAGLVQGNTDVTISGGHVWDCVYGGGELASVGMTEEITYQSDYITVNNEPVTHTYTDYKPAKKDGVDTGKATVTIEGGQIGPDPKMVEGQYNIPIGLTGEDGYVYGGGQGVGDDPANDYKFFANVNSTLVTVNIDKDLNTNENRIWGSAFGGSQDGHVLGDAELHYVSGLMGTKGTTSYDGNIFGGGRNFHRKNHTAGRVRGNITVEMTGGQLYGSIFGGGRLGPTGVDVNGLIIPDEEGDNGETFGSINVRVKGGKVGNNTLVPVTVGETTVNMPLIETFSTYSMGDVFGGGKGTTEGIDITGYDRTSALLISISKNTNVEISEDDPVNNPTIIYGSVYGGGEVANVGTCRWGYDETRTHIINVTPVRGTGVATVTVSGGRIGLDRMRMRYDIEEGVGKFGLKYNDDLGHVFGGGQGVLGDPNNNTTSPAVSGNQYRLINAMANVFDTHVTIEGTAWVKGSVYGGSENGHVWWDTDVKIKGGQIGAGDNGTSDEQPYTDGTGGTTNQFFNPLTYTNYTSNGDIAPADALSECCSWPYDPATNRPFDQVALKTDYTANGNYNNSKPTDGKTWFGNVFGGGSGYYPYVIYNETTGKYESHWNREAGIVKGNTSVEITGGHILTSVYGGSETTDVGVYDFTSGITCVRGGKSTVKMSGGTLGVPRTFDQTSDHPVTCYLFGAGKGNPGVEFNQWTNVNEAVVEVSGGKIYGSIFGGGEEGHVITDIDLTVKDGQTSSPIIGTTGRSYVDGNVFGGGRGFSGEALTAGVVQGDVVVNITGGTMLGSVYGGGRLASVGTYLVSDTDPHYGQLIPDVEDDPETTTVNEAETHGHITVTISGGVIGNDYEAVYHTNYDTKATGGNVFTGAMGRLENLDGRTVNPLWPNLGKVKTTSLTVSDDAVIKSSVYGGGEFGLVDEDAHILVTGGTIWRDVFGGGMGSNDPTITSPVVNSPMQLAGRVGGDTEITVQGGWIKKSIYGGGEMATVGIISGDTLLASGNKHMDVNTTFALSWPYKFTYTSGGTSTIRVTDGRIGITGSDFMGPFAMINGELKPVKYDAQGNPVVLDPESDEYEEAEIDNGDIYGGGKGYAGDRYTEAHANNVKTTSITIQYPDSNTVSPEDYKENPGPSRGCITGAVYGGGENGHVIENTVINLKKGLVGHNIYGGGKGKGKYQTTLYEYHQNSSGQWEPGASYLADIYSITAGKVYGNTNITMEGGYVVRNIFGGGNMASTGKGNYASDPADYRPEGYGEKVEHVGDMANDTLNSGHAYVTITGGQLGFLNPEHPEKVLKDDLPYGSVYGGSRGTATPDVPRDLSPRFKYCPEDFLGYINNTHVVIGSATGTGDGPRLYGSVYGGGQDGHVRRNSTVTINKGTIGVNFGGSELVSNTPAENDDPNSIYWINRGNVYGAGSGIGQWKDESNVKHYSYTSGSVTQFSKVNINGGTIYNSVYGGGNLATVGPPRITQANDCPNTQTGVTINVFGPAQIGPNEDQSYGGRVYGASRGMASNEYVETQVGSHTVNKPKFMDFALCSYTEVNIGNPDPDVTTGPTIYGSVFGGGENGQVGVSHISRTSGKEDGENIHNTLVNINKGSVLHSVYGGGQGSMNETVGGVTYSNDTISGRILGSTEVNLMGGTIGIDNGNYAATIFGGCRSSNIWGNTQVNVGTDTPTLTGNITIYGTVFGANNHNGTPYGDVNVDVYKTAHTGSSTATAPYTGLGNSCPNPGPTGATVEDRIEELRAYPKSRSNYAINGVYGGGNLADYTPKATKNSTVHVYECRENTIYDVFGGGNNAVIGSTAVNSSTHVIIDGGRIHRLFGGGNGMLSPANVYGNATTDIKGGLIDQVFGGSNNNGLISGDVHVNQIQTPGCTFVLDSVFGGGNNADITGDVVHEISCDGSSSGAVGSFWGGASSADIYGNVILNVFGGDHINVFGGSCGDLYTSADILDYKPEYIAWYNAQSANAGHPIHPGDGGNVTLNIFGGTIVNAFGGSDYNGQIAGKITVNVFDLEESCELDLTNVYGGGNHTTYTPSIACVDYEDPDVYTPVVNIMRGDVKGNVYGGSKGAPATTKAKPLVNIGCEDATYMHALIDTIHNNTLPPEVADNLVNTAQAHVMGNVYGGGNEAPVAGLEGNTTYLGNTIVNVVKANTIIDGNVYGGGVEGTVDGNSTVNIFDGKVGKIAYTKSDEEGPYDGITHVSGGSVFGGGKGCEDNADHGRVKGNSTVNISGGHVQYNVYGGGEMASVGQHTAVYDGTVLTDLVPVANTGLATVNITGGQVGPAPRTDAGYNIPIALNGIDGYVFGGGKGNGDDVNSVYKTFANVNQTSVTVNIPSDANTTTNRIWGSIFGGAEDGHVLGDAYAYYLSGLMGTDGTTSYDGNIFGGGRNYNRINTTAGRVGGNTHVEMRNGQIYGNIYGGGRLALTGTGLNGIIALEGNRYQALRDDPDANTKKYGHTFVEVKGGTVGNNNPVSVTVGESTETMPFIETFSDNSMGNVYGGGKGSVEGLVGYPAASAMLVSLVKSTNVEISGTLTGTRIWGIVFGGGELANVGNYSWEQSGGYSGTVSNIHITDGLAKVRIHGGIIGADRAKMRYEPGEGEYAKYPRFNDDLGYVYGGGEGLANNPADYVQVQVGATEETKTSLLNLLATVNNTDVKITGGLVKASVFGGAESGHVRGDARVTLMGGQIGVGDNGTTDEPVYTDGIGGTPNRFINPVVTEVTNEPGEDNTLYGTYHWQFGRTDGSGTTHYDPYDPSEMARGGIPSDGKSWFGNVFGGGSGWFPYITGTGTTDDPFVSHWNPDAGKVWGDTYVVIADSIDDNNHLVSSPHILNNVYGANEASDVGGKATITMSGGTVGVPRTKAQVDLQPTICYVFGGGAGDPRTVFDGITNVGSTEVNITGGIVYGSVFGGAEDGHVLGNVDLTVSPGATFTVGTEPNTITYHYPVIGSTGKSGADGNIFCGGRNFMGDNLKAGRVEGNITLDMSGGALLGSVFGGGRYALTGIDANGAMITTDPTLHGNTDITISGGTVGNESKILAWLAETDHTSMGDVFAGGKGHIKHQDLGKVKNSKVTITGTARVLGSVFGGGELANVGWYNSTTHSCDAGTGRADVIISGGQVGLEQNGTFQPNIVGGNVYGGGYGRPGDGTAMNYGNVDNTHVNISGGYIVSSVFGGGEDGHVWNDTEITMVSTETNENGGIVGQRNTLAELLIDEEEQVSTTHIYTGSVLGGGRGIHQASGSYSEMTGRVFGNTNVTISGGTVRRAVYGGGGLASVGTYTRDGSVFTFTKGGTCTVTVNGKAIIGPTKADLTGTATDAELAAAAAALGISSMTQAQYVSKAFRYLGGNAGWVFGAGCGLVEPECNNLTYNKETVVAVGGEAQVVGSVYGGGENGRVYGKTNVTVNGSAVIGGFPLHGSGNMTIGGTGVYAGAQFESDVDELDEDIYGAGRHVFRGNVYGGGKGTDKYQDASVHMVYNNTSGRVFDSTKVTIGGSALIYNRVYGGGHMASVGTFTYYPDAVPGSVPLCDALQRIAYSEGSGMSRVRIKGGTIGTDGNNNGDVVGGGRGLAGNPGNDGAPIDDDDIADQVVRLAYVGSTDVIVSAGDIKSNVYGGSINGHVHGDSHVKVSGGTIGYKYKPTGETNEVVHGAWHSNVFGGGGGTQRYTKMVTPSGGGTPYPIEHLSITSGRVYGNSTVEIEGGTIWHNVYGGGAIASVGTYDLRNNAPKPIIDGTGTATVTVTGGTIGLNGDQNGMVFGSGRGQICNPDVNPENYSDSLSYTANTIVNIGTSTSSGSPVVKGSVYGSGENGHVYEKATVHVYKGTIGDTDYNATLFPFRGNVYGSGCGTDMYDSDNNGTKDAYNPNSGLVWGETEVNIHGGTISRNVYGGGAMASVGTYIRDGSGNVTGIVDGTGNTVVNISGGTIGTTGHTEISGDVFGGSRGPSGTNENGFQDKALVEKAFVNISGTTTDTKVLGSVYGGGNKSVVRKARVVTMDGGTVYQNVFGGSHSALDASNPPTPYTSLKTVNIRDGHIMGNVFGCSNTANEQGEGSDPSRTWTSFVNITGGQIDGNVYGAGYGGAVNGSLCLMVGREAVKRAPTYVNPMDENPVQANIYRYYGLAANNEPTPKKTKIGGSLYGGSHHAGNSAVDQWGTFDITGASAVFVDGFGYDTEHNEAGATTTPPYMNIAQGIFGSGEHCESGDWGREIIIRNYGKRNSETELSEATRTLTTIQRGGIVLLDNSNVNLSGDLSISNPADPTASNYDATNYGIYKVDLSLYVANGSGIVLGSNAVGETPAVPAYMDSIRQVKSLYLKDGLYSYDQMGAGNNSNWEVVGILGDMPATAHLYRLKNVSGTITPQLLTPAQENVIRFNDASQLHVRYKDKKSGDDRYKDYYGELQGFFRMRSNYYDPYGTESFAYARPKITDGENNDNTPDGGFLSYEMLYNDFTDAGEQYTNTIQYPYINVLELGRGDRLEYRKWVKGGRTAQRWYVDGRDNGWGNDKKRKDTDDAGHYPDKPKKTLFGTVNGVGSGIISEDKDASGNLYSVGSIHRYNYKNDMIYVVGALSAKEEAAILHDSIGPDNKHTPLVLYRYPGHHLMSNGVLDEGNGTSGGGYVQNSTTHLTWGAGYLENSTTENTHGPGANYGALLDVQGESDANITLQGVVMDGLYTYSGEEATTHEINTDYYTPTNVDKPLIMTHQGSELTLEGLTVDGGTVLKRGYNKTDAALWFTNPDYKPYNTSGVMIETEYHGGALFVDSLATVNVNGMVTIAENWQKKGSEGSDNVLSNVYLPTFSTKLVMTGPMMNNDESDVHSSIGVTSPKRNRQRSYEDNTLSPVAIVPESCSADIAENAWTNDNFTDDQQWFFGNGNHTTYYDSFNGGDYGSRVLSFGWTWANVVREMPTGFAVNNINSAEDLAWLISMNTGMNGVTPTTDFSDQGQGLLQTADIDLLQYVWVPIGEKGEGYKAFAGHYDGQGHLISNLSIKYIGNGDTRYKRKNYGMFGYVTGSVDRTFVVSGRMEPEIAVAGDFNVGGLVGCLEGGNVTNSEAALDIYSPNLAGTGIVTGGLVAKMVSGVIHSSMAMPKITALSNSNGPVGGLVGSAVTGSTGTSSTIYNSFVNGAFNLSGSSPAGGLLGSNNGAVMENCYANWSDEYTPGTNFKGIVGTNNGGNINCCYAKKVEGENAILLGDVGDSNKTFTSVGNSDQLGYMYEDNKVLVQAASGDTPAKYEPLFKLLNSWAYQHNTTIDSTYAHWARPALAEINGDLPLLLLNEFDVLVTDESGTRPLCHQGNLRSVATYADTKALQYGGPVRDGDELGSALIRPRQTNDLGNEILEYLFVYGDVLDVGSNLPTLTAAKVSIHEDASIVRPGLLSDHGLTYVGVTFDNSSGKATASLGINEGLPYADLHALPRDWHMFSTPLSNAPLGFNYHGHNEDLYNGEDYDASRFYHNPWRQVNGQYDTDNEFSWLQSQGSNSHDVRYWMYGWENSQSQKPGEDNTNITLGDDWVDGYFPSQTTSFGIGLIEGTDECPTNDHPRYPYGMDFYTWNEPQYHWINFKRNGPNHWHSDVPHVHLDYVPAGVPGSEDAYEANVNENSLIPGRGYMMSIAQKTFMQSHGNLTNTADDETSIMLTNNGWKLEGWNLVGNPFHGYLDFNRVAEGDASNVLDVSNVVNPENNQIEGKFYVVYNADKYKNQDASTAYRYYPVNGSANGDYAERFLHPHQGFYVKAKAGGGELKFKKSMLVSRADVKGGSHFRNNDRPAYPLVNLYLSSDQGCADVTVIEFERPEWGGARKLKELRVGDGLFYAHHDGTYYAALFAQAGVERVPLWFEAKDDDIFTIKWNTANGDFQSMYLIDNIAGVQYDMLMNNAYTFEGHKDDYPSRFYIVFNVTGVEEYEEEHPHFAFFDGSEWVVTGDGVLQFIDVHGRILAEERVSGQSRIALPQVADGPYLFRLTNSHETKVQKVIVRH